MELKKKDAKKIKKATKEELSKLHEQYKTVAENVSGLSPGALLVIAIAGIFVILYFQNKFLVLVGLCMLLCSLYVFIRRGAHRDGYFEGYYEMMTKLGSRDEYTNGHTNSKKSDQE